MKEMWRCIEKGRELDKWTARKKQGDTGRDVEILRAGKRYGGRASRDMQSERDPSDTTGLRDRDTVRQRNIKCFKSKDA